MALKTMISPARPRPGRGRMKRSLASAIFADHMLLVDYGARGWAEPRIVPYGPLSLWNPAASVLH